VSCKGERERERVRGDEESECAGGRECQGGRGEGLWLGFWGEEEEKERRVFSYFLKKFHINHGLITISC